MNAYTLAAKNKRAVDICRNLEKSQILESHPLALELRATLQAYKQEINRYWNYAATQSAAIAQETSPVQVASLAPETPSAQQKEGVGDASKAEVFDDIERRLEVLSEELRLHGSSHSSIKKRQTIGLKRVYSM